MSLVVLSSDLLEVSVVHLEVLMLDKLDEKLSLLGLAILIALLAIHVDGLGSDVLEHGVLVSIGRGVKIFQSQKALSFNSD